MSAEQGDVEVIREALLDSSNALVPGTMTEGAHQALAALDRLAADLERAERNGEYHQQQSAKQFGFVKEWQARAQRAERALAEMREALEDIAGVITTADGLIRRPDRALDLAVDIARATLRPSEKASDES